MNKKRRRAWDDFFYADFGGFTGGGIFDEPAKVKLGERPEAPKRPLDNEEKIRKLTALLNDPAASQGEKENARRLILRLRG